MAVVTSHSIIRLPVEDCWEKLRDLTQAVHYVPGVTEVEIITDLREGVGASRIVTLDGPPHQMEETVTDWTDGAGFTLKIHKNGKSAIPVLSSFYFHYRIQPDSRSAESSQFTPAMEFTVRFGPLGRWLLEKAIKTRMQQTVHVIAAAMAEYYETGMPLSEARVKELQGMDFDAQT